MVPGNFRKGHILLAMCGTQPDLSVEKSVVVDQKGEKLLVCVRIRLVLLCNVPQGVASFMAQPRFRDALNSAGNDAAISTPDKEVTTNSNRRAASVIDAVESGREPVAVLVVAKGQVESRLR